MISHLFYEPVESRHASYDSAIPSKPFAPKSECSCQMYGQTPVCCKHAVRLFPQENLCSDNYAKGLVELHRFEDEGHILQERVCCSALLCPIHRNAE